MIRRSSCVAVFFAGVVSAQAATFTVTNLNDGSVPLPGSLRQAIDDANTTPGPDAIAFTAGLNGVITLTAGELAVTDSVEIHGPGETALTISGNDVTRVFFIYNPSSQIDVTISGLTITHGFDDAYTPTSGGGGIGVFGGNLLLDHVTLRDNRAHAGGGLAAFTDAASMNIVIRNCTITENRSNLAGLDGWGGGLGYTCSPGLCSLSVESSTISRNTGNFGGGIYAYHLTRIVISNTTISGNAAVLSGGTGGAAFIVSAGNAIIESSTIVENQVNNSNSAGIRLLGNTVLSLTNTIVANNSPVDLASDPTSSFAVRFSNVETPASATISNGGGNLFGVDPQLGPLADNGGPTLTHHPVVTSPVIHAGDPAFAPPPDKDQRGFSRVSGLAIDMGSVEVFAAGTGTDAPTLSDGMLILLAMIMAVVALTTMRQRATFL